MPKYTWLFAGILSALILGTVAVIQLRESRSALRHAEAAAQAAGEQSSLQVEAAHQTNAVLVAQLDSLRARAAELEEQFHAEASARSSLAFRMRAELESRDITISELQGRLTVSILDRVLFDLGETELKPEGQAILSQVARVLTTQTNRQIQVAGHTDNLPITHRTRDGFTDNWGLSAGRATAAVRYLQEKAGVDPARLSAVGYGEYRPLADNATPEGRARNRRIAVVILPVELSDPPPLPLPTAPTNSPHTISVAPRPATPQGAP